MSQPLNTAIQVIYRFQIIGKNVSGHKYTAFPFFSSPPSSLSYYLQGFSDIFFSTRTFSQVNEIILHQVQE